MKNFKSHGAELIKELKEHILEVIKSEESGKRWTLPKIEGESGLIITGKNGQNVWDMAVVTLVIELVNEVVPKFRTGC